METTLPLDNRKIAEYYRRECISQAHKKIAEFIKAEGHQIQNELIFPHYVKKFNPLSVDFMILDLNCLVEIDGASHENRKQKDLDKRLHILKIAKEYEQTPKYINQPLDIPADLIYGHLQGKKREAVKAKYLQFLKNISESILIQAKL